MNLPDDFGLSPVRTLSHVGSVRPATGHFVFWKHWGEAVFAQTPCLTPAGRPDPSDPTATHEFESLRHVRIGAALLEPPEARACAAVVTTHGYGRPGTLSEQADRWRPLAERGIAVLIVRVRGFPGSQSDTGDLLGSPFGWVSHGLATPANITTGASDWVVSGAVADVVNACRVMRERVDGPVFLHGESFGGGLAVLAAAQLNGQAGPARLAIGLPTLGDWPWRLARRGLPLSAVGSVGADVDRFLVAHAPIAEPVAGTLRLFDAAIHARSVRCPVLCKLAARDDVVPAPAAAAVFNALATPPGLKRRFVTAYGHFDGGLADLRRHATFDRLTDEFLDPGIEPLAALAGLSRGGPGAG